VLAGAAIGVQASDQSDTACVANNGSLSIVPNKAHRSSTRVQFRLNWPVTKSPCATRLSAVYWPAGAGP
jgi:hypothetical protein